MNRDGQNFGLFYLEWIHDVAKSIHAEHPRLTIRDIIFEVFRPTATLQTDEQTGDLPLQ